MLTKAEAMKAVNKKFHELMMPMEPIKTPAGGGGFSTVWTPRAEIFTEFRKTSVATEIANGTVVSDLTREVGTRYRTDIKKGWRLMWGSRRFDVLHTYSYGRETTVMVCREVVI